MKSFTGEFFGCNIVNLKDSITSKWHLQLENHRSIQDKSLHVCYLDQHLGNVMADIACFVYKILNQEYES